MSNRIEKFNSNAASEHVYVLKSKCGNYFYYGPLYAPYHIFKSKSEATEFKEHNQLGSCWIATQVDEKSLITYTSGSF